MSKSFSDDEIMQAFVDSLLFEQKQNNSIKTSKVIAPIIVDGDEIKKKPSYPSMVTKKVLSDRLKIARNLLNKMPALQEVLNTKPTNTEIINNRRPSETVELTKKPLESTNSSTVDYKNKIQVNLKILQQKDDILSRSQQQDLNTNREKSVTDKIESQKSTGQKSTGQAPDVVQYTIPKWGKGRFQTLIFKVGEIKLAVPLIKLGGIQRLDPQLTHLTGQPEWYMGLTRDQIGNLSVIDTARWIMPDRLPVVEEIKLDYEYVVLLDDTRWSLACSHVQDALMITEDDVKWTTTRTKRPWIAGMLVDHMCALLDVDVLVEMLDNLST